MTFDDESLVANVGLGLPATLILRLGLEALINATVRHSGRVGGARPGRKVLSLVATILASGSHIDHADLLRAGATQRVLPFRVMAPSTLGTFLRAFTFVMSVSSIGWSASRCGGRGRSGRGPAGSMTIDLDSTICAVHGHPKHGAAYGYTRVLGYHPLLATRADTGEVLHARLRQGRASGERTASSPSSSPGAPGWRDGTVDIAGRFGVLVLRADRHVGTARSRLVDHRQPQRADQGLYLPSLRGPR